MILSALNTHKNPQKSQFKNQESRLGFNLAVALINLGCCISAPLWFTSKALGAEEIFLNYGPLEFSLSVENLEKYATEGKIEGELNSYTGYLSPEQLEKFQSALTTSADISHLAIAQFLYSYQGEKILERVSKVIKTKAHQPAFYAIRAALILAAADRQSGGLSPLNVLKKFPTSGIRIDSQRGLQIIDDLSKLVKQSGEAIASVEEEAVKESKKTNLSQKTTWRNLLRPGYARYRRQVLTMRDFRRQRRFPVDLYLPQADTSRHNNQKSVPLIVISHGLGSDRTTFNYLAKHLASHGFAVAVPEHPGSSSSQIQALLSGLASDVTPPLELVDRPLDIKFLLDELEQKYGAKLDTQNVGIIGQSFGAYTALALAGAELNFEQLDNNCNDLDDSWNLSLLLQCLALELPGSKFNLQDKRITSAIAINPLTSAVFGEAGLKKIDIPVMLVSGSADPITPAVEEQIRPFTWLDTANKYLLLLKGGTHFSALNESSGSIPVPEQAIGPSPKVAQAYIKQLGLAFFQAHLLQNPDYPAYLSASYAAKISQDEIPLSLVRVLDESNFNLD